MAKSRKEIFKEIPAFPNYLISNKGRVKSIVGPVHKILTPNRDSYQLRLNGKTYRFSTLALLLEAEF